MTGILLVGGGKMGGALAKSWRAEGRDLVIVDPVTSPVKSAADIPEGFAPAAVILAVKPQALGALLADYAPYARQGATFISIVAGKTLSSLAQTLGPAAKIVRAMPNTPAAISQGITVACTNAHVGADEQQFANALLAAAGHILWVDDEALLDPVTALSGSGPAYVFLLIETLTQSGIALGLAPALAEQLARQTVIGSAALAAAESGTDAATLRAHVTSPGGTTEAALRVLMARPGLQDIFDRALKAATARAKELSA